MRNIVKAFILLILCCCNVHANNIYSELEKINGHRSEGRIIRVCIDGLLLNVTSKVLLEKYYCSEFKICDVDVHKVKMTNDTLNNRYVDVLSETSKSGFIYVNRKITQLILQKGLEHTQLSVVYIFQGTIVETEEEMRVLIKLKKKSIKTLIIVLDKENQLIEVYIE